MSFIRHRRSSCRHWKFEVDIRRGRYNNKVRIRVCSLCIQSCGQVQFLFCEILLDIVILNRGLTIVDSCPPSPGWYPQQSPDVAREQCGNWQTNIADTGNRNFIILFHNPISSWNLFFNNVCKAHIEPSNLYQTVCSSHCSYHFSHSDRLLFRPALNLSCRPVMVYSSIFPQLKLYGRHLNTNSLC